MGIVDLSKGTSISPFEGSFDATVLFRPFFIGGFVVFFLQREVSQYSGY